ncbi:penicillin-binding transpeptidase domain-containing protein [Actinocatenispora comari]|uniref:Cell division protein FtsI n=1 Tax=Actinocatenispora comari TaxID=2807577 RepID=A0A8J4A675_9ACTN|nr:penicillin-binding protein 2 [Actinocatenispora comari]GIL24840.1 cell division protein FtsI [Actinocatenispora comari]
MNRTLRRSALVVFVLFLALLGNLTRVQFFQARSLAENPANPRILKDAYDTPRGTIMVGRDPVAYSKDTGGVLRYQRYYPKGEEYAPITGYTSLVYGSTGIERYENSMLNGTDDTLLTQKLSDTVTGKKSAGANVLLTINAKAQDAAWNALKGRKGAAVAVDPKTGKILALVTSPSFDPNPLASHDDATIKKAWNSYDPSSGSGPMANRALGGGGPWPPGSTMKVIVSAAALENGYNPDTNIPAGSSYQPSDGGNEIHNDVPSICPQDQVTMLVALRDSCNTGFARLGVKLGADTVINKAEQFGLNKSMTIPMLGQDQGMPVAKSVTGDPKGDSQVAQSSIGQFNVAETPLQEAMIAGAVANDGTEMTPYLVQEIQGTDYSALRTAQEHKYGQPISADTASKLREMMNAVVSSGTGRNAQIDGIEVGGKTGTAEHGNGAPEHGWFMGYARDNGDPKVAVGVFLESAGESGSGDATQIGGDIMKAVLGK